MAPLAFAAWPPDWIEFFAGDIDSSFHGKTVFIPPGRSSKLKIPEGIALDIFEIVNGDCETTLELACHTRVSHVRLQVDSQDTKSSLSVVQAAQSELNAFTVCAGSKNVFLSTDVVQVGASAHTRVEGLYFSRPGQFVENSVRVVHLLPLGQSQQLFKGLLAEKARARFCGKIRIEHEAQQVNSRQNSSALILGKHAEIETEPVLEILADDVKATHGATVGQLNEDEIFYLQSRGLSRTDALHLLAKAYMNEIVDHIESASIREFILKGLEIPLIEVMA